MTAEEYAAELNKIIDKDRYYTLIHNLGTQLNSRKDRFEKSNLIEMCLEAYSNGRLEWIDGIGRDFNDTKYGFSIEMKYQENCLFTEKHKRAKAIVNVKLKNSLGSNKGTTITNPADFYMISQKDAMAIVHWGVVKNCVHSVPDGIELRIPTESLTFIFYPDEVKYLGESSMNYTQEKLKLQVELINAI